MDVRKISVEDSIFPLSTGYNNKTQYASIAQAAERILGKDTFGDKITIFWLQFIVCVILSYRDFYSTGRNNIVYFPVYMRQICCCILGLYTFL